MGITSDNRRKRATRRSVEKASILGNSSSPAVAESQLKGAKRHHKPATRNHGMQFGISRKSTLKPNQKIGVNTRMTNQKTDFI
jgi:hypothetical protein